MPSKPDGGPAFPRPDVTWPAEHEHGTQGQCGMSKREVYAKAAMQGVLSCRDFAGEEGAMARISEFAFAQADAMLAEGDKE